MSADSQPADLAALLTEIRSCTVCLPQLPAGCRPVVQVGEQAQIVIIGQAPGRRVHESGVPWDDPSGARLRDWLGLSSKQFYDPAITAIIPMGFCYPGSAKSGDNPPRPECAPLWHDSLLAHLPSDRLEVVIGGYAQRRYIAGPSRALTETVADWTKFLPRQIVLPHPSPRNNHWFSKNPWFESETLPAVRERIAEVLRQVKQGDCGQNLLDGNGSLRSSHTA